MTQEVLTRITAATAAMLIGYLLYKVGLELWCVHIRNFYMTTGQVVFVVCWILGPTHSSIGWDVW